VVRWFPIVPPHYMPDFSNEGRIRVGEALLSPNLFFTRYLSSL
jgi:hypothetical protein